MAYTIEIKGGQTFGERQASRLGPNGWISQAAQRAVIALAQFGYAKLDNPEPIHAIQSSPLTAFSSSSEIRVGVRSSIAFATGVRTQKQARISSANAIYNLRWDTRTPQEPLVNTRPAKLDPYCQAGVKQPAWLPARHRSARPVQLPICLNRRRRLGSN